MTASGQPSEWLTRHAHLLPPPDAGPALDLACGRGRHALWLAAAGFRVHAVDRDPEALAAVCAATAGLQVETVELDLEAADVALPTERYAVVVGVHYLHRPLFSLLCAALAPGAGVLVYETFTVAQAQRGRPRNPAFLLAPGELRRLCLGLEILADREGDFDGRMVASIVARRS